MSASVGTEKGGRRTTMTFNITHARLIPKAPPMEARARLSARN